MTPWLVGVSFSLDVMHSIKLLAAGLYHDNPNQSREYLKSAVVCWLFS